MRHTFLLEEGTWQAEGTYLSESGDLLAAHGQTSVMHREDLWVVDGGITVDTADGPLEFRSTYEIRPLQAGARVTTWRAENPDLGTLGGVFVVMENTILSQYRAEKGPAVGAETLEQRGQSEYEVRGILRLERDQAVAWTLRMVSTA